MNFVYALLGGVCIGLAAAAMHLLLGRVAGISGICSQMFSLDKEERNWRALFMVGLLSGGALMFLLAPAQFSLSSHHSSPLLLVVAGLLVGFGTRLGCGCTSGHGVCGLSRLSFRSLIATCTFIAAGVITVALVH